MCILNVWVPVYLCLCLCLCLCAKYSTLYLFLLQMKYENAFRRQQTYGPTMHKSCCRSWMCVLRTLLTPHRHLSQCAIHHNFLIVWQRLLNVTSKTVLSTAARLCRVNLFACVHEKDTRVLRHCATELCSTRTDSNLFFFKYLIWRSTLVRLHQMPNARQFYAWISRALSFFELPKFSNEIETDFEDCGKWCG